MSAIDHDRYSICTASGLEVFPFELHPRDVRLSDIAHALAFTPRFGGRDRGRDRR